MKLLRDGMPAARVVEEIMADDPLRDNRQVLVIDAAGQTAIFCGPRSRRSSGARQGEGYVVGGCGLPGQGLLDAAAKAFEAPRRPAREALRIARSHVRRDAGDGIQLRGHPHLQE